MTGQCISWCPGDWCSPQREFGTFTIYMDQQQSGEQATLQAAGQDHYTLDTNSVWEDILFLCPL